MKKYFYLPACFLVIAFLAFSRMHTRAQIVNPTPWLYITNGSTTVPTNALKSDPGTNTYILDENGNYILTE